VRWRSATPGLPPDRDWPEPKASRRCPFEPTPWSAGNCSVMGASEVAPAVPCPSVEALPRSVRSIHRERSTMRSTLRATRSVAEVRPRDRLAWINLPIDVPDLMPDRGNDQLLDVWSCDAGNAACFVLAVLHRRVQPPAAPVACFDLR
jgi:hypothetical protein